MQSKLLTLLRQPDGHRGVHLEDGGLVRLAKRIDVYTQRLGSFSEEQVQDLIELCRNISALLTE